MQRFSASVTDASNVSLPGSAISQLPETQERLIREMHTNPECLASYTPKELADFYRLPGEESQTKWIQQQILFLFYRKCNLLTTSFSTSTIADVLSWQVSLITELFDELSEQMHVIDHMMYLSPYLQKLFELEKKEDFRTLHFVEVGLNFLTLIAVSHPSLGYLRLFVDEFSNGLAQISITVKNNNISRALLKFRSKIVNEADQFENALSQLLPDLCIYAVKFANPIDSAVYAHLLLESARWMLEPVFGVVANKKEKLNVANQLIEKALSIEGVNIDRHCRLLTLLQLASQEKEEMYLCVKNIKRLLFDDPVFNEQKTISRTELVAKAVVTALMLVESDSFNNLAYCLTDANNIFREIEKDLESINSDSILLLPHFHKILQHLSQSLLQKTDAFIRENSDNYVPTVEAVTILASFIDKLVLKLPGYSDGHLPVMNSLLPIVMNIGPYRMEAVLAIKAILENYVYCTGSRTHEIAAGKVLLQGVNKAILMVIGINNTADLPDSIEKIYLASKLFPGLLFCFEPKQLAIIYRLPGNQLIAHEVQTEILAILTAKLQLMEKVESIRAYYEIFLWACELVVDLPQDEIQKWIHRLASSVIELTENEIPMKKRQWLSIEAGINITYIIHSMQSPGEELIHLVNAVHHLIRSVAGRVKSEALSRELLCFRKAMTMREDQNGDLITLVKQLCQYAEKFLDFQNNPNHMGLLFELARWNLEPVFNKATVELELFMHSKQMIEKAMLIDPHGINISVSQLLVMAVQFAASPYSFTQENYAFIVRILVLAKKHIAPENSQAKIEYNFTIALIHAFGAARAGVQGLDDLKIFILAIRDATGSNYREENRICTNYLFTMTASFSMYSTIYQVLLNMIENQIHEPDVYAKLLDAVFAFADLDDALVGSLSSWPSFEIIKKLHDTYQKQPKIDHAILSVTQKAIENYLLRVSPASDHTSCLKLLEQIRVMVNRHQSQPVAAPTTPQSPQVSTPRSSASPLSFLATIALRNGKLKESQAEEKIVKQSTSMQSSIH